MKIILLDKRNHFRDDARTRLLVDDDRSVELVTDLGDSNNLASAISRYQPDLIVVADNVYSERSAWGNCGVPVVGYMTTRNGEDIFTRDGIPHYPQIATATHLLNLLEGGIPTIANSQRVAESTPSTPADSPVTNSSNQTPVTRTPTGFPAPFGANGRNDMYSASVTASRTAQGADCGVKQPNQNDVASAYGRTTHNPPASPAASNNGPSFNPMFEPMSGQVAAPQKEVRQQRNNPTANAYQDFPQVFPQPSQPVVPHQPATQSPARENPAPTFAPPTYGNPAPNYTQPNYMPQQGAPAYPGDQVVNAKTQLDDRRVERNAATYSASVLEDIAVKNTPTKTVAVYSAKGGVGKTTITTELATILSMTSNGRGNYRVCLVDYNIDFGDILTTLNLDNRGPNLTHWASDVRRRIQSGENPEDIYYGRKEIEGRLQRVGNTSLYALVAPITHEDSMDIRSEEPGIILRNIIDNGCFDFVICDTGNNTRDATVSALDAANVIFMIATQDVSAVNCDKSFLQTMHRVGFDVDKIRLIMNGIMPYKYTQVSVEEVEAMFPYPCVARFKRDPEVTRANNCSVPIVKNPNHEFTREMRKIVAYLTGKPIPQEKAKGGFFSMFNKKKG